MKHTSIFTALALVISASLGLAAEIKIKTVMKEAMKGDKSLFKNVTLGKGTDADAQKLLEYVKALSTQEPPKGDKAAWKAKVDLMVKSAEDVVAKKSNAGFELQKAGNCKACHADHKED
jgi:hypothetical protein